MRPHIHLSCLLTLHLAVFAQETKAPIVKEQITLTLEDCLFFTSPVPKKGIVCSNYERAQRLGKKLINTKMHTSA